MKTRCILCAFVLVFWSLMLPASEAASEREATVRKFVDAFNRHDLEGMLALADENVQWASVQGTTVSIDTNDKQALRASMQSYWKSCPTCASKLIWVNESKERVAALEEASWTGKDGKPRSQQGISVYEFREGKISRVYYFPAEK